MKKLEINKNYSFKLLENQFEVVQAIFQTLINVQPMKNRHSRVLYVTKMLATELFIRKREDFSVTHVLTVIATQTMTTWKFA